jgi:predicted RNA-binding protein YlxR (DUF448 family)
MSRHGKNDAAEGEDLRRCLVTGDRLPREALLRFVVAPDGDVVADMDGRLPGRGLWLRSRRDMVKTACAGNLFAKASGGRATATADLAERVEERLTRRCLDLIGLARRAGQVATGFEKVRVWLRAGKAGVLLAAADGAVGGRAKLRALASGMAVLEAFSGAQLGAALGRESAGHVAVARGGLAERLMREVGRLRAFRQTDWDQSKTG